MSTQTALRATVTPHVNLLPGEIREEAQFRSMRAFMALAVIFSALVGGALFVQASGEVTSAQEQLDTAKTENAALQAKVNTLADVPKVYAQVAAADAQLTTAMGAEVRYSYLLNDLSLSMNRGVWLSSLNVAQAATTTTAAGTPVVSQTAPQAGIALITVAGRAKTYEDVAAWLEFLTADKTYYTNPYVTSADRTDKIGNTPIVKFASTVALNDSALSHRYDSKAAN